MELNDIIRNNRLRMRLSQAELGERLGVSQAAIGQWERGVAVPRIKNAEALADLFDLDVDMLMLRIDQKFKDDARAHHLHIESVIEHDREINYVRQSDKFTKEFFDIIGRNTGPGITPAEIQRGEQHWLVDYASDVTVVNVLHPRAMAQALGGGLISNGIIQLAVMRASLSDQRNFVLIVRAPSSGPFASESGQISEYEHAAFEKFVGDALILGVRLFLTDSPAKAAKYLLDLEKNPPAAFF